MIDYVKHWTNLDEVWFIFFIWTNLKEGKCNLDKPEGR